MSIPAIGPITALTWALEIGEVQRFSSIKRAISYCGLCGDQRSAADHMQRTPLTALAYVLIIGTPARFHCGKQIGTYVGMVPSEDSSAGKQRLGHISKQGNSLLRFLLVEAAQAAARINPEWRRRYIHLAMRRHRSIAKVAMGRRLAVRLYWMWRNGSAYSPSLEFGSYVGQPATGHGVQ